MEHDHNHGPRTAGTSAYIRMRAAITLVGIAPVLVTAVLLLTGASHVRADAVVVAAGFNDASGIGSNPTPNSPYTLGMTIDGRGAGELGWTGTWIVSSGGGPEAPQLANAIAAAAIEGDGGMSVTGGVRGGAFIHRPFTPQVGRFTISQYLNLRSSSDSFGSRPADNRVGDPSGIGPGWNTTNGTFHVGDGDGNGGSTTLDTGIKASLNVWYKVAEEVDTTSGTWEFLVNDKPYASARPLHFRGNPTSISNIDYLTGAAAYVDAIQVTQQNPADLNHDGVVDFADLLILAQHFNGSGATFETGDISGDGHVDFADLLLLTQRYGQGGTVAAPVPEPSLITSLILALGISRRRRHTVRPRGGSAANQFITGKIATVRSR